MPEFVHGILNSETLNFVTWAFISRTLRTRSLGFSWYTSFLFLKLAFGIIFINLLCLLLLEETFEKWWKGLYHLLTLGRLIIFVKIVLIICMPGLFCPIVIVSKFIHIVLVGSGSSIRIWDHTIIFHPPFGSVPTLLLLRLILFQFYTVLCTLVFIFVKC